MRGRGGGTTEICTRGWCGNAQRSTTHEQWEGGDDREGVALNPVTSVEKYETVQFEFLSAGDSPSSEHGVVVLRPNEMVLEVNCPGDRPYVITGKKKAHGHYEGVHHGLAGD